jgi:hypothetical protein
MGFRRAVDPLKLVQRIKAFAPSLTNLCIPLTSLDNPQSLLFEYHGWTLSGSDPQSDGGELALFLKTLSYLVVRGPGISYSLSSLEGLEKRVCELIVVERAWERGGTDGALLRWENAWLDGINSGEGYWDLTYKD